MNDTLFYAAGSSPALTFATKELQERGICFCPRANDAVTHLLLPTPSFDADGAIYSGVNPVHILSDLPPDITVIGGNLSHPALQGYRCIDLLKDPRYLAENAAITADCALRIAGKHLSVTFAGCPVLIIGWGRIGKCLARDLKALGAQVWVAARKESDRAMLCALGYGSEDPATLCCSLLRYRMIFNTAPHPVLSPDSLIHCRKNCVKIDLASIQGIYGSDVIHARGLPGKQTPESSGILIAKTIIRLLRKEDTP